MQAGLDLEYSRSAVTWARFDEMDEVAGAGSAELQDDGSLEIEFAYHLGDEAVLKAFARLLQQPANAGSRSPNGPSAARSGVNRDEEMK
jgi:hypothetical protein